ncbi:MAG: phosphotransferase [Deltaproteobacteria bacterium]|jgi:Ser/Thr protein kinase RdoA (MazF antagonist)|nr:phosphotransferase [Deltaproteobacteria bacterium]
MSFISSINAPSEDALQSLLARAYLLEGYEIKIVKAGRVNLTYSLSKDGAESYILQKLSPFLVYSPLRAENWSRVALTLKDSSVGCPHIIPDQNQSLLSQDPKDGAFWRLSSFLPGRPPLSDSPLEAQAAGETLARVHLLLNRPKPMDLLPIEDPIDFELTNQNLSLSSDFELIKNRYRGHPNLPQLLKLIERGQQMAAWLPTKPPFVRIFRARDLVIHKDCKSENFLLGADKPSLLDWDTAGYGDPLIDLGELCRSLALQPQKPFLKVELAAAVVNGYRRRGAFTALGIEPSDFSLIAAALRGLCLNLARRYLIDSLAEVYFRWDEEHYPSLFEQNLSRAEHNLDLVEELLEREIELIKALGKI